MEASSTAELTDSLMTISSNDDSFVLVPAAPEPEKQQQQDVIADPVAISEALQPTNFESPQEEQTTESTLEDETIAHDHQDDDDLVEQDDEVDAEEEKKTNNRMKVVFWCFVPCIVAAITWKILSWCGVTSRWCPFRSPSKGVLK